MIIFHEVWPFFKKKTKSNFEVDNNGLKHETMWLHDQRDLIKTLASKTPFS